MALLIPLFPSAPALSVVKHVVKEPFLTRCGIHCRRLSRRALFHVWGLGYCTSAEAEKQGVFSFQAYQFLTRLYKEYSLAGRGDVLPAQEPTKASGGAIHSMIVVVPRVQLKHRVDPFVLEEGLDIFRVLADASQDRVPDLALLISQRKVHTIWPLFRFMGEDILFHTWKPERAGHAANP